MDYGFCTDVGRVREHNEDFILVDHLAGIFIVADGMGGYKGGEIASREASLFLLGYIKTAVLKLESLNERREALMEGFSLVNSHIAGIAQKQPELQGMGTTGVLAVLDQDYSDVIIAHVGDSRAYYLTESDARQLTKDHSLIQELIDIGSITREEAEVHPKRHVITQAIGSETPLSPEIMIYKIQHPGVLLLCTDGLSNLVEPNEMKAITFEAQTLQSASESLVQLANSRGGTDNCSVVLVGCHLLREDEQVDK